MRLRLGLVEHDLTTHALVMGVLAHGRLDDALLERAEQMVGAGADLIDVGGVQAGPGPPVGEDEELERLVPVVAGLRDRFETALAVETWRPRVLAAACAAGAVVGRDATGAADAAFLATAAEAGATVVTTCVGQHAPVGGGPTGLVSEVRRHLAERVAEARKAGVAEDRIIVDAGLGQGREPARSLALLRQSADLADLGPPLLLDASNGIFLGPDGRRVADHAAQALGIARGCRLVRTAEVRAARRVADVLGAVLAARRTQTGRTEQTERTPTSRGSGG